MKRLLRIALTAVCALCLNGVAGAVVAGLMGFAPLAGAIVGPAVALIAGAFIPAGALPATVFTEIWTGEMIKAFRT
ncbi:MAG: hypothetical protein LUC33_02025, partial [Prevotellaceae bacterium]|nr:hypothetical protein [Prevotellaceae bacterium]